MRVQGCRRIYGLGESLGASILIGGSAVEHEPPYADLRAMGEYHVQGMLPWPAWLARPFAAMVVSEGMLYAHIDHHLDLRQVTPLHSILVSSTPVVLIHGLGDRRTPPEQSRRLAAVRPDKDRFLGLVPRGGHTDPSSIAPHEFRTRVLD